MSIKFNYVLPTDGSGLWSRKKTDVQCTKLVFSYLNDEEDFGELRVYFDTNTWNIETDGLIYTDNLFEKELQKILSFMVGLDGFDVSYSEQGMQGVDYVSCDVGKKFIDSWQSYSDKNISLKIVDKWLNSDTITLNNETFIFPHGIKQIRKLLKGL